MAAIVLACLTAATARAQEADTCLGGTPGAPSVYIDSSASDVTVLTTDGRALRASRDLLLCPGDEVRTGATGRVAIRFDEKRTMVRLDGNTRTRVLSGGAGEADVSLLSGVLYFISSVRQYFEVDTPYIVAGIDGTEALVGVQTDRSLAIAAVREGIVSAYDKGAGAASREAVDAGQAAFRSRTVRFQVAAIGDLPPPFRDLLIVSDSAVDWAVYYPPILFAPETADPNVRAAITLLQSGDYAEADRALAGARQVDPARVAALRTIIAVARNRLEEAARWSAAALAAGPRFAPAHIAASYERQAVGDLDGARQFAIDAAALAPDDAYVAARLAELQMLFGERVRALTTAEQSLAIRRTPLALFVAGLARLAAWEYETAEALFAEAIALDTEAPLPRLGLGLAYVRRGNSKAGAWEIERAVAHDPKRASLRTWLGRAYFDEQLGAKAAAQFAIAQRLDPQDPTPHLFSALERYAANDPIGALRALQAAEARGGARATIRSERGLGEDTATRGAALGRVFDTLEFNQLAVIEGSAAADADPANPGAHRFLADAYRLRRDQDIARSSELLRSQLLSPPSKTPVQPELAETGLALLDTTGPSRVTFAEFSPFFDGDGLRVDASGLIGTQNSWGDQIAVTGLYRNASISLGQFHYETDGFRANNDLEHDIYNGVATFALSPEFSLFGEYRNRESTGGDRVIDFDITDFAETFRATFDREVARIGFHASPSPAHNLIGVYTRANLDTSETEEFVDFFGGVTTDFSTTSHRSDGVQLQHILQHDNIRNQAGAAYNKTETTTDLSILGGFITDTDEYTTEFISIYDYLTLEFPMNVDWTIGGAYVKFKTEDTGPFNAAFDVEEFLPKIGVHAELNDYVTLRAAYLKNIKPELVSEQVLEPSQVAGFSQYYDALNSSLLEQLGGGIDLMLSDRIIVGAEAIKQWWTIPFADTADVDTDERILRGYAYATLTDYLALSAEIVDERSESENFLDDFAEWHTTSVPVTLSMFKPSGIFATVGVEYVDHRVLDLGTPLSDTFGLVNASLGFRLPNNRGMVSVEAQNLLDEEFSYQNRMRRPDIGVTPRYAPERVVTARGNIAF